MRCAAKNELLTDLRTTMLTEWTLGRLKAVSNPVTLTFKPITVFAGLNSSGKSTVLQSVLMISQTLSNQNPDKPCIINGNIVQLGTFTTILNDQSTGKPISIGFRLTRVPRLGRPLRRALLGQPSTVRESLLAVKALAMFVELTESKDGSQATRISLDSAQYEVVADLNILRGEATDPTQQQVLRVGTHLSPMSDGEEVAFLSDVNREAMASFVPYPSGSNYRFRTDYPLVEDQNFEGLVRLNHFLPGRFISKYSVRERVGQRHNVSSTRSTESSFFSPRPNAVTDANAKKLNEASLNKIKQLADSNTRIKPFHGTTVGDFVKWARTQPLRTKAKSKFIAESKALLIGLLMLDRQEAAELDTEGLESRTADIRTLLFDAANQVITSQLTELLRYLGPLRADPQAAQGFSPSSEPDDVGTKGEYAAAVYDSHRHHPIRFWEPTKHVIEIGQLSSAVDIWARYLGVAHHVSTNEAGVSGVSWSVEHLAGSAPRPLSAVGIGVSQILPILVAGLLAPQEAILLIEQPELHLHARAQARLADFFVGLSRIGKQCIVETHSECFVNQLRYSMVSASDVRNDIAIYFVHQDQTGAAHFDSINISESGAILNWPDGFFDESLHQADRIAHLALSRRSPAKPQ